MGKNNCLSYIMFAEISDSFISIQGSLMKQLLCSIELCTVNEKTEAADRDIERGLAGVTSQGAGSKNDIIQAQIQALQVLHIDLNWLSMVIVPWGRAVAEIQAFILGGGGPDLRFSAKITSCV